MSNLIKYPFVNMQGKKSVVVGHEKEESFVPLHKKILIRPADEVEAELKQQKEQKRRANKIIRPVDEVLTQKEKDDKANERGASNSTPLEKTIHEPEVHDSSSEISAELIKKREDEARAKADKIIEDARKQADFMISEATEQVEMIRENAREEGLRVGREEGIASAEQQMAVKWQELDEQKELREQEYQQLLQELEPHYVDILCSLIHKITGVVVTDRKDVFLHLIRSGMTELEPSGKFTIRVSQEDIVYVESHKEELLLDLGPDIIVDIQEEKGLEKNDCIIETDTQMIDCGLHTQISNLISTLRMLM